MQDNIPLDGLTTLADYFSHRTHIFPGKASGDWFLRQNKPELVKGGALLMVCGRWMAVAPKFDAAVLEIGQRAAEKAAA